MSNQTIDFKAKGNTHMAAKEWILAIESYTNAIELSPDNHTLYSNRSAAYLSSGDKQNALLDAEKCIRIMPSWAKGYARKGAALHALKEYQKAIDAYEAGLAVDSSNENCRNGLADVTKVFCSPIMYGTNSFGEGPLSHDDFEDYKRRYGNKCPTEYDAYRFAELHMKIDRYLKQKDIDALHGAILCLRNESASDIERKMAHEILRIVKVKALQADPNKVEKNKKNKENVFGCHFRLLSDPTKRGVILKDDWKFATVEGQVINVIFDGETNRSQLNRTAVQILCSLCKEQDGKLRCSRCMFQNYCSSECQHRDWDSHKPNCKKSKR